ncbi:MAG: signal peptidase I [Candidatus Bathyarchaeota archaeon]|nr:signal peptidase I [Candidatus Bathyarchaeota archaeon]
MAAETIKRLWKNEYFQTVVTVALLFLIVLGLYFGAQATLGTPYPALAVASGSMLPTLNIGDLIIVQKIDPAQINADPNGLTGDVLVYKRDDELIVHRAVKIENRAGVYYITTRGDNSGVNDPPWPSTNLVGKVIMRIPYIGNLPLFLHSERNMYLLFLVFLVLLIIILMLPSNSREGEKTAENTEEKSVHENKTFKIRLNHVFYIILNGLVIGLIIFSLWGSCTFWQPGASPPSATVRGMYVDQQYHKSFPNVYDAVLSQGFLTYRIDCELGSGTRLGVPTFAWYQFFILVLILFHVQKIYDFWKKRTAGKRIVTAGVEASKTSV